jgi:hypothetical protein
MKSTRRFLLVSAASVLLGVGAANATQLVPVGAKVTLEVDHQEYFIGENVIVHFILENVGNQPFCEPFNAIQGHGDEPTGKGRGRS